MLRTLVLGSVLILGLGCLGQSWCPPGAQWNYSAFGMFQEGNVVHTYVGDTVIDGYTANKIHRHQRILNFWSGSPPDSMDNYGWRYTALVDSMLLVRNLANSEWDTLHRFDATVGDRWWPPFMEDFCMDGISGMLIVVDTGTIVIDGLALRSWTLDFTDWTGQPYGFESIFTERLGHEWGFEIYPTCFVSEYGESLACYKDEAIEYHTGGWPYDCASLVGLDDERPIANSAIFPNPGSDHVTLQLPGGVHSIEVFDATGRSVLRERTSTARPMIDTSTLAPGLYLVQVDDVAVGRWLKE